MSKTQTRREIAEEKTALETKVAELEEQATKAAAENDAAIEKLNGEHAEDLAAVEEKRVALVGELEAAGASIVEQAETIESLTVAKDDAAKAQADAEEAKATAEAELATAKAALENPAVADAVVGQAETTPDVTADAEANAAEARAEAEAAVTHYATYCDLRDNGHAMQASAYYRDNMNAILAEQRDAANGNEGA